jgi:hypothetical protein
MYYSGPMSRPCGIRAQMLPPSTVLRKPMNRPHQRYALSPWRRRSGILNARKFMLNDLLSFSFRSSFQMQPSIIKE